MKALLIILITTLSYAHDLSYTRYLRVQQSLASDDFQSAKEVWKEICSKELGHYVKDFKFQGCTKDLNSIKALRESFKTLSQIYIRNGESLKKQGLAIYECPMAKAKWIQKVGTVTNPYYGY
ncbi:DUF3347 domain-containing protein [Bacteriovorax sp. DB6_IX]|uniref:DUF3347 domain-containing protein n=1 Tax=Bacteriovorax sp. DB6_IX TaxID=1353530 RepID=UPI00038A2A36|nr:DUF3347 domain-containing protein [Bacteriovorax sp. DB6_IX]EQC51778.1 PF11827 family protein [Bacteriovorax sp. DB6_IX]